MTEDAFLRDLFPRLGTMPPEIVIPPGDDCAAICVAPGRLLLLATDQVIGDRHYRRRGPDAAAPEQVGRKLLARNLSDIAAMGGRPLYALVTAALGPDEDEAWLRRFFDGLLALAREWQTLVIGGDLARTPADLVTTLTIVGEVAEDRVCRRSGARPGNELFATGRFGSAFESGHHLAFTPRLREAQWLAEQGAVTAMIDVSDGLLLDARRLCAASGVSLRLEVAAVPLRTPQTTREKGLADGEDYELLIALEAPAAARIAAAWPFADVPFTRIGLFTDDARHDVLDAAGRRLSLRSGDGYDHFAAGAGHA